MAKFRVGGFRLNVGKSDAGAESDVFQSQTFLVDEYINFTALNQNIYMKLVNLYEACTTG